MCWVPYLVGVNTHRHLLTCVEMMETAGLDGHDGNQLGLLCFDSSGQQVHILVLVGALSALFSCNYCHFKKLWVITASSMTYTSLNWGGHDQTIACEPAMSFPHITVCICSLRTSTVCYFNSSYNVLCCSVANKGTVLWNKSVLQCDQLPKSNLLDLVEDVAAFL